ncbi:A24 family peptidase [Stieleria tagensis]|uniref:A24 family peptidase n=1 Tax=Stieleria tagensis TaxID=2956795 RepID=UPI00209AF895|nr:A24 family peptidase [Stieleria tagensis]
MNRHRLRKKLPLLGVLAWLAALLAGYVVGLAWFQAQIYPQYSFADLIVPRLIDATIVSWLIYFCSSIGSFLNVVAWRLPRGESIGGRSRCPRCACTLNSRDNVPVLGWISLGGRCRFCSLPISRRYPIVEALVGISLTVVGVCEIYSLSLPGQIMHWHGGPLWAPHVTPILLGILTYHAVLLSTLWGMALIRIDGARLPNGLTVFAALAAIVPMLAFPTLMIVPWQTTRPSLWSPHGLYFDAVMRVVTALVAAALFGRVLAKGLCPSADLKLNPLGSGTARLVDLIVMLSIPAILIGWQSMPALVIASAILAFLTRPLLNWIPINDGPKGQIAARGAMESFSFALPLATTLHLALWRMLWSDPYWPSDQSSRNVIIAAAAGVLLVPLFLRQRVAVAGPTPVAQDDADPQPAITESTAIESAGDSADELPQDHGDGESDHGDHRGQHSPGA